MPYYGVYIPGKSDEANEEAGASGDVDNNRPASDTSAMVAGDAIESPYVFSGKLEALKMLKTNKDARMREFSMIDDAINYAHTGYEVVQTKYNDVKTSTAAVEKPAFCGPTKQKLVVFRKAIESGDYEFVKSLIWDNPRYLVNSGDTPTSLKEGCRYNALHVCAIYNMVDIAELILKSVSDPYFVNLLTGSKNDMKMCTALAANLLDYYLNIPEKVRLETPLHLAAKYGSVEIVKLLTSYPICRMTRNKDNMLPSEIIFSRRMGGRTADSVKIRDLLEKRFYVPVIRSVDNDVPPKVGQPFSVENPPNLSADPLSPEMKIQALAGPMKEQEAKKFCRRWKTPPRIGSNTSLQTANNSFASTPIKCWSPSKSLQDSSNFETPRMQHRSLFESKPLTPYPKQLLVEKQQNGETPERVSGSWFSHLRASSNGAAVTDKQNGNNLTNAINSETLNSMYSQYEANNNPQQEDSVDNIKTPHTPPRFPTPSIRISHSSPAVFQQVEQNSNISIGCERNFRDSPGFKERHIKITDTEKGLEVIGRKLAKAQMVEWCEYWDFLNIFLDIASPEGLQKLESFFEQRIREEETSKKASQAAANSAVLLDDVCSAFEKIAFHTDTINHSAVDGSANNESTPKSTTPYTYVEKSLQVFAKRMTKTILHNIENVGSINDAFLSELKRLRSLICSFKDDSRFFNVNFGKVHSRFAYLIANYLDNSQDTDAETKAKIKRCLHNILMSPSKKQLHCVCRKVNSFLEEPSDQILPENLKTESMYAKAWLTEEECECQWETDLSRKTSRRNRMETRYKNHQQQAQNDSADEKKDIQTEDHKATAAGNHDVWHSPPSYGESTDDDENDVFWSDFGSETEDEDVWMTPPETSLQAELMNDETEEDRYNLFIYGNEPTKRDLDVFNAIFNVDINNSNYPNIYNWKMAVLRHIDEGMNTFPSPAGVNETNSSFRKSVRQEGKKKSLQQQQPTQQLPIPKRLFMSPTAGKNQPPVTPLNKMRGLFSTYREYLNSSPMSESEPDPEPDSEIPRTFHFRDWLI